MISRKLSFLYSYGNVTCCIPSINRNDWIVPGSNREIKMAYSYGNVERSIALINTACSGYCCCIGNYAVQIGNETYRNWNPSPNFCFCYRTCSTAYSNSCGPSRYVTTIQDLCLVMDFMRPNGGYRRDGTPQDYDIYIKTPQGYCCCIGKYTSGCASSGLALIFSPITFDNSCLGNSNYELIACTKYEVSCDHLRCDHQTIGNMAAYMPSPSAGSCATCCRTGTCRQPLDEDMWY